MSNLDDDYRVLDLEPGASLEEVNQAYKDLAFVWHPDRLPKDNPRLQEKAQKKLKELNQARDRLRHRQTRQSARPGEKLVLNRAQKLVLKPVQRRVQTIAPRPPAIRAISHPGITATTAAIAAISLPILRGKSRPNEVTPMAPVVGQKAIRPEVIPPRTVRGAISRQPLRLHPMPAVSLI